MDFGTIQNVNRAAAKTESRIINKAGQSFIGLLGWDSRRERARQARASNRRLGI